jgi:hypothetical protein
MGNISSSVTGYLLGLLTAAAGLDNYLEGAGASETSRTLVTVQNAAPDLVERSTQVKYPAVYIYCERLNNTLKEKFARFSGDARLVIEIRCSQDRIEGIEQSLDQIVDAACKVLDGARGSWQDGAFYTGTYEVSYGTVRHGGKNFIQIAKIAFEVQVSQ